MRLSLHVCLFNLFYSYLFQGSGGSNSQEYSLGHLVLSGLNFTCHGLTEFMLKERVEYAWMMKLDLGKIVGSISGEQVCQ